MTVTITGFGPDFAFDETHADQFTASLTELRRDRRAFASFEREAEARGVRPWFDRELGKLDARIASTEAILAQYESKRAAVAR